MKIRNNICKSWISGSNKDVCLLPPLFYITITSKKIKHGNYKNYCTFRKTPKSISMWYFKIFIITYNTYAQG